MDVNKIARIASAIDRHTRASAAVARIVRAEAAVNKAAKIIRVRAMLSRLAALNTITEPKT